MEIKHGLTSFDPRTAVKPIVQVLHEQGIPIGGIPQVFELVMQDVISHSVPYNAKKFDKVLKGCKNKA